MKKDLLITTDLGLFKAYELSYTSRGTPHLDLLLEQILEDAHHRLAERLSDAAGRHAAPAQKGAAPMADDHNIRLETRRRLIKQIGGKITELVRAGEHSACSLAADPEINGPIMAELPADARSRIRNIIPFNLVKADQETLLGHLSASATA